MVGTEPVSLCRWLLCSTAAPSGPNLRKLCSPLVPVTKQYFFFLIYFLYMTLMLQNISCQNVSRNGQQERERESSRRVKTAKYIEHEIEELKGGFQFPYFKSERDLLAPDNNLNKKEQTVNDFCHIFFLWLGGWVGACAHTCTHVYATVWVSVCVYASLHFCCFYLHLLMCCLLFVVFNSQSLV